MTLDKDLSVSLPLCRKPRVEPTAGSEWARSAPCRTSLGCAGRFGCDRDGHEVRAVFQEADLLHVTHGDQRIVQHPTQPPEVQWALMEVEPC